MKKLEICSSCGCDYIPKRRGVQKFCSNSCRSRHWQLKQALPAVSTIAEEQKNQISNIRGEQKNESMSFAGVGNAAAGVVAVDVVKSIFTPEENRPAKKKDIKELKSLIVGQRYLPINNLNKDPMGRFPYYDVESGDLVYLCG